MTALTDLTLYCVYVISNHLVHIFIIATYWQRVIKKIIDSLGVGLPALYLLNSLKENETIG